MPKYIITNYVDVKEIYYITADSEEDAFDILSESEPDEEHHDNTNYEIDIDNSLDEAEESDLKERRWNEDIR